MYENLLFFLIHQIKSCLKTFLSVSCFKNFGPFSNYFVVQWKRAFHFLERNFFYPFSVSFQAICYHHPKKREKQRKPNFSKMNLSVTQTNFNWSKRGSVGKLFFFFFFENFKKKKPLKGLEPLTTRLKA